MSNYRPRRRESEPVASVVRRVRISRVCAELTGTEPRPSGRDRYRAIATWRSGDGFNVSIDDIRGVWHDPVTHEGGGILDLIVRIRGGSRRDAFRWLKAYMGEPLTEKRSMHERRAWAKSQREIERDLPDAICWRRAMTAMFENLLEALKAGLEDPGCSPLKPEIGELAYLTAQFHQLSHMDSATLVQEYREQVAENPRFAAGMVEAAKMREEANRRALTCYLEGPDEHP